MMPTLTDWKNQSVSIDGLINPSGKDEARAAADAYDRLRDSWTEKARPRIRETLNGVLESVRRAAGQAERPDQLVTQVEAAATAARPMYENTVETLAEDIGRDFYVRILDALDGDAKTHAEYLKQNGEDRPTGQGATQEQDETEIGTAIGLFLAANAAILYAAAHSTTKQIVIGLMNQVVDEAVENGWSTKRAIEEFVDRLGISSVATEGRIKRIARTLVTRLSNWAALKAAKDHSDEWLKDWVSVRDNRVRPAHLNTDLGQDPIALDEFFDVGGFPAQYPSDPRLPPQQSINCRCSLIFLSP